MSEPYRADLVGVEEVVDGRVVLVDRLLHEAQAERPGVELDVPRRVRRDRGDVVDALEPHGSIMPYAMETLRRLPADTLPAGRELEPEGRALALDAGEADAAAVRLDDLARDGQAEADAGDAARLRLAAEELREDARLVLFGGCRAPRPRPRPGPRRPRVPATTTTCPPSGEYLIAFATRLTTTCASRSRSPTTRQPVVRDARRRSRGSARLGGDSWTSLPQQPRRGRPLADSSSSRPPSPRRRRGTPRRARPAAAPGRG